MNNKRISFLFGFLFFFFFGGWIQSQIRRGNLLLFGVTLTDTKGNKYKFKNESVTCRINNLDDIYCEGSAIKKDIAGNRYAFDFREELCKYRNFSNGGFLIGDHFICDAAKELGKFNF